MSQGKRVRSSSASLELLEPQLGRSYSLEHVIHHTGVSRRTILIYCNSGLIHPMKDPEQAEMTFDDEAIYMIRHIEQLRENHGINLAGIRIIVQLLRELRQLRDEIRFRR